jgi:hypothetical protein
MGGMEGKAAGAGKSRVWCRTDSSGACRLAWQGRWAGGHTHRGPTGCARRAPPAQGCAEGWRAGQGRQAGSQHCEGSCHEFVFLQFSHVQGRDSGHRCWQRERPPPGLVATTAWGAVRRWRRELTTRARELLLRLEALATCAGGRGRGREIATRAPADTHRMDPLQPARVWVEGCAAPPGARRGPKGTHRRQYSKRMAAGLCRDGVASPRGRPRALSSL